MARLKPCPFKTAAEPHFAALNRAAVHLAATEAPGGAEDLLAVRLGQGLLLAGGRDQARWAVEIRFLNLQGTLENHFHLRAGGDVDVSAAGKEGDNAGGGESGARA